MSAQNHATEIPIGEYDWIVLKEIGNDYFVCAVSPLFKGYYSLEACPFPDSKLYKFLNERFAEQIKNSGIDMKHIRNIGIMSAGQYRMYVQNRVPNSSIPFLLQTPFPDKPGYMTAVDKNGELIPVEITAQCGIRPCFFINSLYVKEVLKIKDVHPLADINIQTEEKQEKSNPQTAGDSIHPDETDDINFTENDFDLCEDGIIDLIEGAVPEEEESL